MLTQAHHNSEPIKNVHIHIATLHIMRMDVMHHAHGPIAFCWQAQTEQQQLQGIKGRDLTLYKHQYLADIIYREACWNQLWVL